MNMQLIQENCEFDLNSNHGSKQKILCVKGDGSVDQSTVTKWLKKMSIGLQEPRGSSRPKTVDYEAVLQT